MPTNRSNIKLLGTKTWIIILGIIVALMISINTGILSMSEVKQQHQKISTRLSSLLAQNSKVEESSDDVPSFLQLSKELHKLYVKIIK